MSRSKPHTADYNIPQDKLYHISYVNNYNTSKKSEIHQERARQPLEWAIT
jgi:hypothetical protein